MRENRNTKIVTTEKKSKYLVSERNYHTTKFLIENLLTIKMKRQR